MKFLGAAILLALAQAVAFASPAAKAASKKFYVRTKLLPDQPNPQYDGLWLEAYHTTAGTNAATFSADATKPKSAIIGYLNNTFLEFNLYSPKTPYSMLLQAPDLDFYSGWFSTAIDTTLKGSKGFSINKDGYIVGTTKAPGYFGGWRVCLWNHGVPELFHNYKDFTDIVPPNCALTYLVPQYV